MATNLTAISLRQTSTITNYNSQSVIIIFRGTLIAPGADSPILMRLLIGIAATYVDTAQSRASKASSLFRHGFYHYDVICTPARHGSTPLFASARPQSAIYAAQCTYYQNAGQRPVSAALDTAAYTRSTSMDQSTLHTHRHEVHRPASAASLL